MALPNTGISTSLVANTIGAGSNDVGTLCTHPNVNEFGFNTPDATQMSNYWGKTVQERVEQGNGYLTPGAIGYPLGVFRGYDHNWLTFKANNFGERSPDSNDYYKPLIIQFPIQFTKASMSNMPFVPVGHTFSVYFNRVNNFTAGNGTLMPEYTNVTGAYPYMEINVSIFNPPDGGSALAENSTFYLKVVHNSSPERRWFISGETHQTASAGGDSYVFQVTVPNDPYTYVINLGTYSGIFVEYNTTYIYNVNVNINADLRVDTQVPVEVQISKSSDFSVTVFTQTGTISCLKNTTSPGTAVPSGSGLFSFPTAHQSFIVGDTVYYRVKINNGSYSTVQTGTVVNTPPWD